MAVVVVVCAAGPHTHSLTQSSRWMESFSQVAWGTPPPRWVVVGASPGSTHVLGGASSQSPCAFNECETHGVGVAKARLSLWGSSSLAPDSIM